MVRLLEDQPPEIEELRVLDDRYVVSHRIGEGGLGTVYAAYDRDEGRDVAIKVLIPRYRGRPEREARLFQELELCRRVGEHPNIVRAFGGGRLADFDGAPYVVLERVEGELLRFARKMELGPAVDVARLLADAVRAVHRAGVVHRDVNVHNILVRQKGEQRDITLIDFSHGSFVVAPDAPPRRRRLTMDGEIPGTPRSMSPEQCRGEAATPAMDVYAYGAVLFELLTGANPFVDESERGFIERQAAEEIPHPKIDPRVFGSVPRALVALAHDCMRPVATERPDMNHVVQQLDTALAAMRRPAPIEATAVVGARGLDRASGTGFEEGGANTVVAEAADAAKPSLGRVAVTEERPLLPEARKPRGSASLLLRVAAPVSVLVLLYVVVSALWSDASVSPDVADGEIVEQAEPVVARERVELVQAVDPAGSDPEVQTKTDVPPVEPPPALEPQPVREPKPTPSLTPKPRPAEREPPEDPKPAIPEAPQLEPSCADVLDRVQKARIAENWSRVLRYAKRKECWTDADDLRMLRVTANLKTGRYEACVEEAEASSSPKVHRIGEHCKRKNTQ